MSTEPSSADRPRLPPKAERTGAKRSGTGAMAAAGIAAGVAATLGVAQAAGAFAGGGGGDGDDADALAEPALEDAVFDEVAGPAVGGGGGGGGGGHRGVARSRPRPAAEDDDVVRMPRSEVATTSTIPSAAPAGGDDFEDARQRVLRSLDDWEAPEGADPEEAAALRAELTDRIVRFVPAAGQSVDDAVASLRDEVDEQVKDFAQDERIEAIVDELRADDEPALHDDFDDTVVHALPWDDPATEHDERQGLPDEHVAAEPTELPDVVGDTAMPQPPEPAPIWNEELPDELGPDDSVWIEPWPASEDDPRFAPLNDAPDPVVPDTDAEMSEPADGLDTWDVADDAPSMTNHELPATEPAMG